MTGQLTVTVVLINIIVLLIAYILFNNKFKMLSGVKDQGLSPKIQKVIDNVSVEEAQEMMQELASKVQKEMEEKYTKLQGEISKLNKSMDLVNSFMNQNSAEIKVKEPPKESAIIKTNFEQDR